MAERFDPYHKWLGIPPKDQPPHHYRLLGVEQFESDPEVIDAAANRLLEFLQGVADGPHLAAAQELMNEIASARLCLLDPKKKAAYDKSLRAQQRAKEGPNAARQSRATLEGEPVPPPPAPPVVSLVAPPAPRGTAVPASPRVTRKRHTTLVLSVSLGLLLLAVSVLAVYLLVINPPRGDSTDTKQPLAASGQGKSKALAAPGESHSRPSTPGSTNPQGGTVDAMPRLEPAKKDITALPKKEPSAPQLDPAALAALLKEAEEALQNKDVKKAEELLRKYVNIPDVPELDKALDLLSELLFRTSDEIAMKQLSAWKEESLIALENDRLDLPNLNSPFKEIYLDTLKRNLPKFKERRAMKSKEVPKENKENVKEKQPDKEQPKPKPEPMPVPVTSPEQFLASKNLKKRDALWLLNEDPLVAKLSSLSDLEKKYQAASNKATAAIRATRRSKGAEDLAGNEALRDLIKTKIAARNDLALTVMKLRKELDAMEEMYQQLRDDPQVAEALSKLPGNAKEGLGPSNKFTQARGKFAKTEAMVMADDVPLYLQGQSTVISTIVNEEAPIDFALSLQGQPNVLPEAVAKKAGIPVEPSTPTTLTVNPGQRKFKCREIKVSVRIGKHVFQDVDLTLTPPEAADLGARLSYSAFGDYPSEADRDNFVFRIRAPGEPAEKKKAGKTAKIKP